MTVFTTARHLSLSSTRRIQSSYSSALKSTEIFFCLRPDLPNGLFPSGLPTTVLCTFTCHITLTTFSRQYRSCSSSLHNFLQSTVPSSLSDTNTPSAPYTRTSSACVLHKFHHIKFHSLPLPLPPPPPSGSNYNLCIVLFVFVDTVGRNGAVNLLP
jgi:hypothetical protein